MVKLGKIKFLNKKRPRKFKTKIQDAAIEVEKCKLYDCFRTIMRLCRWFGAFPVEGLNDPSISRLRYNIKSVYSIYVTVTFIGQCFMTLSTLEGFFDTEISVSGFSNFIFYLSTTLSSVCLLIWSRSFSKWIKEIASIEGQLTAIKLNKKRILKIIAISLFVLFLGLVEHLLCIVYVLDFVMKCQQDFSINRSVMEMFFVLKLDNLSLPGSTDFKFVSGILLEITNTQATFVWTYIDVLIINASMYLVSYFSEFNKLVNSQIGNKSADWGLLQRQHSHLVALTKKIDSRFNILVLISFCTNLFFSCVQLFNTLRTTHLSDDDCDSTGFNEALDGIWYHLYYSFSFWFLIIRTLTVCLAAANVNTYAFEPVYALGEIHASNYSIQIQRFYRQLTYTTIGLSGVFFYCTRTMILKVLGTLTTYELVLLQFNNCGKGQAENSTKISFMSNNIFH